MRHLPALNALLAAVLVVVSGLAGAALAPSPASAVPSAKPPVPMAPPRVSFLGCPSIIVYGIRGSGDHLDDELLGLGAPGKSVFDVLTITLGPSAVGAEADGYPAVPLLSGGLKTTARQLARDFLLGDYTNSVNIGIASALTDLAKLDSRCHRSRLVLIGYSQGAQVLRSVLQFEPPGFRKRVAGVLFFGDPAFNGSEGGSVKVYGGGNQRAQGLLWLVEKPKPLSSDWFGHVFSFCHSNDLVCQRHGSFAAHENYSGDAPTAVRILKLKRPSPPTTTTSSTTTTSTSPPSTTPPEPSAPRASDIHASSSCATFNAFANAYGARSPDPRDPGFQREAVVILAAYHERMGQRVDTLTLYQIFGANTICQQSPTRNFGDVAVEVVTAKG